MSWRRSVASARRTAAATSGPPRAAARAAMITAAPGMAKPLPRMAAVTPTATAAHHKPARTLRAAWSSSRRAVTAGPQPQRGGAPQDDRADPVTKSDSEHTAARGSHREGRDAAEPANDQENADAHEGAGQDHDRHDPTSLSCSRRGGAGRPRRDRPQNPRPNQAAAATPTIWPTGVE